MRPKRVKHLPVQRDRARSLYFVLQLRYKTLRHAKFNAYMHLSQSSVSSILIISGVWSGRSPLFVSRSKSQRHPRCTVEYVAYEPHEETNKDMSESATSTTST